jgi:hypothetical protein
MRRQRDPSHPAANAPRTTRRIHEESPGKLPELAACPRCHASYRNGRWTWEVPPLGSYTLECPACERIADDDPAGELRLSGRFVKAHRSEIEGCLRNVEERQRAEHPLKRIMSLREDGTDLVVRVTDSKLVTQLGHALESAWDGDLVLPKTTADRSSPARGTWHRD